jgi:CheY-like chemotaxis protein
VFVKELSLASELLGNWCVFELGNFDGRGDGEMIARYKANGFDRPRMVLAHARTEYSDTIRRFYDHLGWDLYVTRSGLEARELANRVAPAVVILGTDLPDESGWLTCDKLRQERPGQRIVLVSNAFKPGQRHFASFVGAEDIVQEEAGIHAFAGHDGAGARWTP